MVVGSRKTARARPCSRPHTGRSLVSASRESGKWLGPPQKRRALRAYRRVRPCPSPPLGVVAPHRIPRLAAVACLARYASSLAGVTFSPAQPPSVINSPCEKTNLTQKQPYVYSTAHENVLARKSAIASHPNVNVSCLMRWRLAMAGARGPHAPRATALGATGSPAARFVCPSVPPSPRRALPF